MPILVRGRNVWRIERAARVAVLADAAVCFAAIREALLKARRSIFILGWDIDGRIRLVGERNQAEDGYPAELGNFLGALANERPNLKVHLLLWDYSLLFAQRRETFPTIRFQWETPPGVRFSLDDCVPLGSSQHQKVVLIDDALAFAGGNARPALFRPGVLLPAWAVRPSGFRSCLKRRALLSQAALGDEKGASRWGDEAPAHPKGRR